MISRTAAEPTLPHARRVVRYVPVLLLIVAVAAGLRYFGALRARPGNAVVLAPIAGREPEAARFTEVLAGALAEATAGREPLAVRRLTAPITEEQGSTSARSSGARLGAALVVWGSLKPTGPDLALMLVMENMGPSRSTLLYPFGDYTVQGALAEPSRFVLRRRADVEDEAPQLLMRAALRYREGSDAEADRLFTSLLERDQSEGRAALLLSRGNIAVLTAMPQAALKSYAEVLQAGSLGAEAHNDRGLAYAMLNNHPMALAEYTAALSLNPEEEAPYVNRGISYIFIGEYRRAIRDYDRVLKVNPRAVRAFVARGVSWAALGEHKRALQDFSRAIAIEPSAVAHLDHGLSRAALGEHRQAVEDFSRALQMRPTDPRTLVSRGRSRSYLKDQVGAIADYTAALEMDPKMPVAYYERGIARTILGQHQQAIDDFSAAISINPRYGDAYKGRGVSQMLRREYPPALDDFGKAIEIDPHDAEAYFQRGITHRLRGEPRKALPDMEKVLEASGDPALRKQAEEQLRQIRSEP